MAYVGSSDDFRIFYNFYNPKARKPPIVLVHGLMSDSRALKDVAVFFKKHGFPVVTLDLRGHGKSTARAKKEFYSMDRFVADVKNVVDETIKNKDFVLVGYSLGGMVSLRYLELFPEHVRSLVLLNTFYKSPIGIVGGTKSVRNIVLWVEGLFARYPFAEKLFHKVIGGLDYDEFKDLSDLSILAKQVSNNRAKIVIYSINSVNKFDLSDFVKTIKIPTLIVAASDDQLFPAKFMKRMSNKIRKSNFVVFEGTHSLPLKKPLTIAESILGFLSFNLKKKF